MKPARLRYLLILFAVMFLGNGAAAGVRGCMVNLAAQEHAEMQIPGTSGDEQLCPEADSAANRAAHCMQSYKNADQKVSFDAPTFSIARPILPHRASAPARPAPVVMASAPPAVGPPLTILFGNRRN